MGHFVLRTREASPEDAPRAFACRHARCRGVAPAIGHDPEHRNLAPGSSPADDAAGWSRNMSLTLWFVAMFLLGIASMGCFYAFLLACEKI